MREYFEANKALLRAFECAKGTAEEKMGWDKKDPSDSQAQLITHYYLVRKHRGLLTQTDAIIQEPSCCRVLSRCERRLFAEQLAHCRNKGAVGVCGKQENVFRRCSSGAGRDKCRVSPVCWGGTTSGTTGGLDGGYAIQ
jgi:hypothetical protein